MYLNDRLIISPILRSGAGVPVPPMNATSPPPPPIINNLPSTMIYYWHNLPWYNELANIFMLLGDSHLMGLWASILFSLEPHMIWLHFLSSPPPALAFSILPTQPFLILFCFVWVCVSHNPGQADNACKNQKSILQWLFTINQAAWNWKVTLTGFYLGEKEDGRCILWWMSLHGFY